MIIDFQFKLDDNTFISERYKESIKSATPSGKFFDRDILGKWTVAEGAIYADFNKTIHVVDKPPDNIKRYYAGVDWGYDHHGSIVILAESHDGKTYIVDGTAERFKYIDWWIEEAKRYMDKYGDIPFYCDTARTEHIYNFKESGINALYSNKSVIAGIEEVAKRWKGNQLFYVKDSIPRFEDEIYQYRWKPNSTKDQPMEEYDDVLDSIRYAIFTQHILDKNKKDTNVRKQISTAKRWFG